LRASLLLAMSDFLDPGRGPEQSGDFEVSPSLFIALFGVGFLIAALGHLTGSRALVAAGVVLVLVATILLPIAYSVSN
jgi:Flp pilus assembly protein TadB